MTVVLTSVEEADTWSEQYVIRDTNGEIDLGPTQETLPRSDVLTARVIRDHFPDMVHYGTQSKQWFLWDGTVHRPANGGEVEAVIGRWADTYKAALNKIKDVFEFRAAQAPDKATQDRIMKMYQDDWKKHRDYRDKLFSHTGQVHVLKRMESICAVDEADFDADGRFFVLSTGVINMDAVEKTRKVVLLAHDPRRLLTKRSTVAWDPNITYPEKSWWQYYLHTSLPDPDTRAYLQRWAGSSLLGKPNSKGLVNLIGPQDSGKSMFINAVLDAVGDYGKMVRASTFLAKKNGDQGYEMHELRGARLVTASEPGRGKQLDDDAVKTVTGNDAMRTREPYGRFVSWVPQCTIFIASNAPMRMDTADGALLNRIKPIVFPKSFKRGNNVPDGERAIPELPENVAKERALVFDWLVKGLLDYLENGLGDEPETVTDARARMAIDIDSCLAWLEEEMMEGVVAVDHSPEVPNSHFLKVQDAYERYVMWCAMTGEKYPFGRKNFSASIQREYPTVTSAGKRFRGLVLVNAAEAQNPAAQGVPSL